MSTLKTKKVQLGDNADPSKNFLIEVPAVADGTLSIKRQDGTNVLSIDATGKAVIPGVVGTVAQVGGIPTGQVVERGSNANGEYVRFADGTQICRLNGLLLSSFVSNRRYQGLWTFPASFAAGGLPTVTHSTDLNHWFSVAFDPDLVTGATAEQTTTTQSLLSQQSAGTFVTGKSTRQFAIAIGRWF